MSHQKFSRRYGFLLLDNVASQDPLSVSVAILHQFKILPEMYQVGYTKLFFRTGQIGVLEDTRNRTLHGILRVQSCLRGHQARCSLKEFRGGITTLQSFIRGDKTRKAYAALLRRHRAVVIIQKRIKAVLARNRMRTISDAAIVIYSWFVWSEDAQETLDVLKSRDLKCRVLRAEADQYELFPSFTNVCNNMRADGLSMN
ncbi:myosin-1-like [Gastrolobium bilobum]|uniref:myosin-1-like n=1 Tax=Gastrolobium bilobum TaxID=150636 RepID=UPI002AB14622|nr:myosin-1-like [Gastrolobium bilobum]